MTNVLSLSVPERIQLVEDIWDTIVEIPEEVGLTDELKKELDSRLAAYRRRHTDRRVVGIPRQAESETLERTNLKNKAPTSQRTQRRDRRVWSMPWRR